jgi:hypothetical protein
MTLLTGIILTNLVISLFLAYKCGKQQVEIDTLYEGLAMTMEKLSVDCDRRRLESIKPNVGINLRWAYLYLKGSLLLLLTFE